jgi:hypothetical protein
MKFTNTKKEVNPDKVRAFIDKDGDLIIVDRATAVPQTSACLMKNGLICTFDASEVAEALLTARQVFFEGDQITITF